MKIPKTLKFGGYNWKIKFKDAEGGSFDFKTKVITIGTKYKEAEVVFLHELIEAILTENLCRYYNNEGNSPYVFNFNHDQFCLIIKELYQVIKENNLC